MENEKEQKEINDNEKRGSSKKEKLALILIFLLVLGIFFGSGYWVWNKIKPKREEKKVSIQNLAEEMPKVDAKNQIDQAKNDNKVIDAQEQLTAEEVKKENIDIKVLNGGAAAGTAAKVKKMLESAGFVKISAENAKLSGYKAVTIYYKKEFGGQLQEIKEIMKTTYGVIETKEGMNEKETIGDIVIILGK